MFYPCPKPRPRALDKIDRDRKRAALDKKGSDEAKKRSGGQCEVVTEHGRCQRRAFHVHHMIGGWGKRSRGPSVLAKHKQHVCAQCHDLLTRNLLVRDWSRVDSEFGVWSDTYRAL